MPDKRQHRGPHPEDVKAFAPEMWPRIESARDDLSWLLTRGYSEKSASTLVGDRFCLTERQRIAVRRCACSDQDLAERRQREANTAAVNRVLLLIDGYNVITTVEAALSGGVILAGRDGCFRDMASMHGNFKQVTETPTALALIGQTLARLGAASIWYLDQPVSNSGRLKNLMLEFATARNWDWKVELSFNPDAVLAKSSEIVATADSAVLDRCERWFNLAREVISEHVPDARVLFLDAGDPLLSRFSNERPVMDDAAL